MSNDSNEVRLFLRNKLMDGTLKPISPEMRLVEALSGTSAPRNLEKSGNF